MIEWIALAAALASIGYFNLIYNNKGDTINYYLADLRNKRGLSPMALT